MPSPLPSMLPPLTRRRWLVLSAGLAVLPSAGASRHGQRVLFGSPVDLLLPAAAPAPAVAALWRRLERIHADWNAWKPGALAALNADLGAGRSHRTAPDLTNVLQAAARFERLSGGCFNAGIGGLVGEWGFHADRLLPGQAPPDAVIGAWRARAPGLGQLRWHGRHVVAVSPRVQVDLGGCAKGWALDDALDGLQRAGVARALLNLGGNLAVRTGPGDAPWRVGIRDPFDPTGQALVAVLPAQGREAVVTSGTYERFRWLDGQRVGHVIDPVGARPAHGLASVTVVHADATLADAAATALLVAGPRRWHTVAVAMGVQQVLVVDASGARVATPALAARLAPAPRS